MGGNREFVFHGVGMALGGSFNAVNASGTTVTNPGIHLSAGVIVLTASGGCLQVVGGMVMKTYAATVHEHREFGHASAAPAGSVPEHEPPAAVFPAGDARGCVRSSRSTWTCAR